MTTPQNFAEDNLERRIGKYVIILFLLIILFSWIFNILIIVLSVQGY